MNITWKITDVNTFNEGVLSGIVHSIKFICICEIDGETNAVDSSVVLPKPDTEIEEGFIRLEDVTEDIAYKWLFEFLGDENKSYIESMCAKPLLEKPQIQMKPLWLSAQQVNKE